MPKTFYDAEGNALGTFYTTEEAQPVLTAGTGITIQNNVISASGGGGGTLYLHKVTLDYEFAGDRLDIALSILSTSNTIIDTLDKLIANNDKIINIGVNDDVNICTIGDTNYILFDVKFETQDVYIYYYTNNKDIYYSTINSGIFRDNVGYISDVVITL